MQKYFILFVSILLFGFHLKGQSVSDSAVVVGDIQIFGNNTTKDYVIRREMSIKIGDTLTQKTIERDRNNIYNLLLFNKVDIDYSVYQDQVTLFVVVSERWYIVPFPVLGMRYRDPSKLYYGLGFTHVNFRGRNEKISANFGSGYDRWLSLNYQNPKVTDNDDIFIGTGFSAQKTHSLNNTNGEYENTNLSLSGTIGKRFGMYQMVYFTLGYAVCQVNEPMLNRTVSASGRDAFINASIQYRFDTRNNREYTTDGSLISLILSQSGLGESDMNLSGVSYDLRRFFGFNRGSSFGVRTAGSMTWGGKIPIYRHVYFGYDERIRGFFDKSIEAENRIVANMEIRLPILLPRYLEIDAFGIPEFQKLRYGLYFGIFADAGKVWSRNQLLAEQPWYSGYGAGLQFLLPYGFTIRTEVAMNNLGKTEYVIDFDTSF